MTFDQETARMVRAHRLLTGRFARVSRHGQLDAVLPKPSGLVFVGGPRNAGGVIPKETRTGMEAAFRGAVRAEEKAKAIQAALWRGPVDAEYRE